MSPSRQRRFLWFAALTLLLNALAPTVAYALAAQSGLPVVELCTSFGLKKARLLSAESSLPAETASDDNSHCGFCLASQLAGLPPSPAFSGPSALTVARSALPPAALAANQASLWLAAQPRAPPPSA